MALLCIAAAVLLTMARSGRFAGRCCWEGLRLGNWLLAPAALALLAAPAAAQDDRIKLATPSITAATLTGIDSFYYRWDVEFNFPLPPPECIIKNLDEVIDQDGQYAVEVRGTRRRVLPGDDVIRDIDVSIVPREIQSGVADIALSTHRAEGLDSAFIYFYHSGIDCYSDVSNVMPLPLELRSVDTTPPTVTINSDASGPVNGPFVIAIAFSEPVIGFELSDLVVGNGSTSALQGDNASYTTTVTPAASGTVTVDIAAGAAQDSAGNPSVAADQFSITADTTAPTVTISSDASEPVSSPFSITVTFSEPVTGFELADLVIGNGSTSDLQGSGATYMATVTPAASGTVTVDIAAGAAQDSAGNPSAATDQFSITADTAAPTVTITTTASTPVTGSFAIMVTFSEPVTGFELVDLTVGNGTVSELQGDNATYTATVTPTASGTVTVDVATGAARDAAGNANAEADQFSIIADLTPVPALPLAGAIVLALLLMVRGARQRTART